MKKRTLEGLWQQWGLGREQQKVEGKQQRAQSTCCGRACNWTNCVTKSCSKMCSEVIAHCLTLLHLYVHSQYLSYYKQLFYTYINDAPQVLGELNEIFNLDFFLGTCFYNIPERPRHPFVSSRMFWPLRLILQDKDDLVSNSFCHFHGIHVFMLLLHLSYPC